MALEIEIKVLNVGDGDAIIVYLHDAQRQFVMLIDGGERKYLADLLVELEVVLTQAGKNAPDLVICTHFDSDHIRGVAAVVEHYHTIGRDVGEVWIHAPGRSLVKEAASLLEARNRLRAVEESRGSGAVRLARLGDTLLTDGYDARHDLLLESLNEMCNLVEFMNEKLIHWYRPFPGIKIPGFPEIEVLGPSRDYFEENSPFPNDVKEMLNHEYSAKNSELQIINENHQLNRDEENPCDLLDAASKRGLSKANLTSVILLIDIEGEKYLFTADAGVKSFESLDEPEKIENLHWLKVPHHGSIKNLTSELIERMSPRYAYISGDGYISDHVVGCLEAHGAEVRTTRDEGLLRWPLED
ncbi:ComEC/Rec2 family competence protein [Dawidia soli]|uniref:MBL fold metallo-hydrolase n=1 Tax=Dawidia soli TaxID=2782352 RepID=A0AAP2GDJ1_9BACT|nr:MBL fold metallo-hydrolase [Dawidia soli]MBT1687394.1 MBL fold metallo-hydrolase [Dawidia soli]